MKNTPQKNHTGKTSNSCKTKWLTDTLWHKEYEIFPLVSLYTIVCVYVFEYIKTKKAYKNGDVIN